MQVDILVKRTPHTSLAGFTAVAFLLLLFPSLLLSFCGCETKIRTSSNDAAPVPIHLAPPFRYQARIVRMYGGDSFETLEKQSVHFVTIEGISTPPEEPFASQSMDLVRKLRGGRLLEIEVIGRDEMMREVTHVYAFDENGKRTNVGLSLLRNGLAWFDHSEGDYAETYQRAEAKARKNGLGMWAADELAPPWETWQKKVSSIRELSETHFVPPGDFESPDLK